MYDVVIIGAGVVGGMVARELSRYQLGICILEKEHDVGTGASSANSGIVHAGFDCKVGTNKARLNLKGSEMMEQIAEELGVPYRRNGSLVIGYNDEDYAVLCDLLARGVANGVRELRLLNRDEVHAIEPNLADAVTCALYAPTGAIVPSYALTIAAIGNAMDNGAELKLNFAVDAIEKTEDGFLVKSANGDIVQTKTIVNCAGVFSDEIAAMVGDRSFTVHARRGEYLLLDRKSGSTVGCTIFRTPTKLGKGILVSPTADGNLLLGPTAVDSEDKTDTDTSAAGMESIVSMAKAMVKNIDYRSVITSFTGLRAVGSTGDFVLTSPVAGMIHCAGIESPGLSSAPAIAQEIAGRLADFGIELKKDPSFNPIRPSIHRFADMSTKEKNEMIQADPSYGRIVCRCESVTEGEIREALERNPKPHDLDGIKFRTRAGMGRCQGGFCSPSVMVLIAEKLGIPIETVTKFGGCSCMAVGKTKEDLQS